MLAVRTTSKHIIQAYVEVRACAHMDGYVYVFDLSSFFPDVLHLDRLLVVVDQSTQLYAA